MFEIQSAATGASSQSDVYMTCDLASNGGRTRDGLSTAESADSLEQVQHNLKLSVSLETQQMTKSEQLM